MLYHLPANCPPERFYRGGARITTFRGIPAGGEREPEDWVGSTTTIFGEPEMGLSRLPSGQLLHDAVRADPAHWLGQAHAARWGADIRILVKLLDAGQRLPVHAHPHDQFAAAYLGRAHGKAEAWYILEPGTVHLGLRRDVPAHELATLVARQDVEALLDLLHSIRVNRGDVVWVPPGELHAIGAGVLLLEVQQPEDLSILLEWEGFAIDGTSDGHLGLGFDRALGAVNHAERSAEEVAMLVRAAPERGSVFPADADSYFRLLRHSITGPVHLEAGFGIVVVTRGEAEIAGEPAPAGSTVLVPAAAGEITVRGEGEVLVARPPGP